MTKKTNSKKEPEVETAGSDTFDQGKPKAFNHYRDRVIPEQQARIDELEVKLTELETANSRLTAENKELTQKVNSQVNPEVNQELTAELTSKNSELTQVNSELTAKLTQVNSELTALKLEVNQAGKKLTAKDLELDAARQAVPLIVKTFGPDWDILTRFARGYKQWSAEQLLKQLWLDYKNDCCITLPAIPRKWLEVAKIQKENERIG